MGSDRAGALLSQDNFFQISILAAIPAIALYVGVTQVRWSVAGEKPVRLAESSALGSALLFYFAM